MLLAIVFAVQAATASPNPCTDQMSALCRISPLFCPSAYPGDVTPGTGNIPCWPERGAVAVTHGTRVVQRPSSGSGSHASSQASRTADQATAARERVERGPARPAPRFVEPR